MRADQWFLLGIGAFGIYAVYRMTKASSASAPAAPSSIFTPSAPLPELAGAALPPGGVALVVDSPMTLSNGRAYRGRLESAGNRSREDLTLLLETLGFDAVRVSVSPEEALADGAPAWSAQKAGRGTRWFYGRWTPPSARVARPAGLVLLWTTRPEPRPAGESLHPRPARA